MTRPARLIDLRCNWLLQYAAETSVFAPSHYADVAPRISQVDGYLTGTSAAVLSCSRRAEDWESQPDPWAALGALVTRIEAEFSGRLLIGPEDFDRWEDDPEGLCWGVLGVDGFDFLIRSGADLDKLPALFDRGVRLFQPVEGQRSLLGGSADPGDDRGLTDLGRTFLQALGEFQGPRPLLDLAHLNPLAMSEALDWLEADQKRLGRILPLYSHGAPWRAGFVSPGGLTLENLRKLRAIGGVIGFSIGPPFFESTETLKVALEEAASVPFRGRPGFEGLAIGTNFLGVDQTLSGLGNVEQVGDWLTSNFPEPIAELLRFGNARALLGRMVSGSD